MKLVLSISALMVLGAGAALACSVMEVKTATTTRGEACSVAYSAPNLSVASGPAELVSPQVLRQYVTKGVCTGEEIVFYYDCAQGRGVWLGGEYSAMGMFSPDPAKTAAKGQPPLAMSSGPAAYFAENLGPAFAPGYDIDAIAAKADTLPWIAQKGRISTPSVTVEGKSFDLSCGCKMRPAK